MPHKQDHFSLFVCMIVNVDGKCRRLQCSIYEHMVVKSGEFVSSRRMPCILTDVRVALATSDVQSILEIPSTDEICVADVSSPFPRGDIKQTRKRVRHFLFFALTRNFVLRASFWKRLLNRLSSDFKRHKFVVVSQHHSVCKVHTAY